MKTYALFGLLEDNSDDFYLIEESDSKEELDEVLEKQITNGEIGDLYDKVYLVKVIKSAEISIDVQEFGEE